MGDVELKKMKKICKEKKEEIKEIKKEQDIDKKEVKCLQQKILDQCQMVEGQEKELESFFDAQCSYEDKINELKEQIHKEKAKTKLLESKLEGTETEKKEQQTKLEKIIQNNKSTITQLKDEIKTKTKEKEEINQTYKISIEEQTKKQKQKMKEHEAKIKEMK